MTTAIYLSVCNQSLHFDAISYSISEVINVLVVLTPLLPPALVQGWQCCVVHQLQQVERRMSVRVAAGEQKDAARNSTALQMVAASQVHTYTRPFIVRFHTFRIDKRECRCADTKTF